MRPREKVNIRSLRAVRQKFLAWAEAKTPFPHVWTATMYQSRSAHSSPDARHSQVSLVYGSSRLSAYLIVYVSIHGLLLCALAWETKASLMTYSGKDLFGKVINKHRRLTNDRVYPEYWRDFW